MKLTLVLCLLVALTYSGAIRMKRKLEITPLNIKPSDNSSSESEEYQEEYSDEENKSRERYESPENKDSRMEERIITNLQIIYGNQGVSVNYRYNETGKGEHVKSAPGCPKSIDGYPWVYYGKPPRCFLAGHHGPCGLRQKLIVNKKSNDGYCACECMVDSYLEENIKRNDTRYISCQDVGIEPSSDGQVFDKMKKVCYERMTKGPCADGEVLVHSTPTSIECFPSCGIDQYRDGENCYFLPQEEAGTDYIESHECLEYEKYSDTLKRCISKTPKFRFG